MNKYIKRLALTVPYIKRNHEYVEKLTLENKTLRAQISAVSNEICQLHKCIDTKSKIEDKLYQYINQLYPHIDLSSVNKYYSCKRIESLFLNFNGLNGQNNNGNGCIEFCCENLPNRPGVALHETPEESIQAIKQKRSEIVLKSKVLSIIGEDSFDEAVDFTYACTKCPIFVYDEWGGVYDERIHFININMYPAPCNSKCIYCSVHSGELGSFDAQTHKERYERMFDAIEWANDNGLIAEDVRWQMASGEIMIHPYKERLFNLFGDHNVKFLTNCFIFDKRIAANLSKNPESCINLSIDAGTPETWYKVKGVDNYKTVLDNLRKYSENCVNPKQITLKYIILLGINDNSNDFQGVINIMQELKIKHLLISSDNQIKYSTDEEKRQHIIKAAGALAAQLYSNGMTMELMGGAYRSADEPEKVEAVVNELLYT